MKKYLIILLTLILVNCEEKRDFNFEPQFNIACILRNDESYPYVVVDRTYSMEESIEYDLQDVFGYISGPGIVDTLVYTEDRYFRVKNPLIVMPESIYSLYLEAPRLKPLRGRTRIPARFRIISPAWFDTITINDSLVFTKSRFEAGYYVWCYTEGAGYSRYWIYPSKTNDTIVKFPIKQFYDYITKPGYYQFYVIACDTNYFNYRLHWGDKPAGYGIENGIGFFGSAWAESVRVYIEVETR